MRRCALLLNFNRKTVERKFEYLAKVSEQKQQRMLEKVKAEPVTHLQFDDLITSEHTKLKPLSVSIAVCAHTRVILGAEVSQIPAFGHLAEISRKKYGRRKSEHKKGLTRLFESIKPLVSPTSLIRSDEHNFYPEFVARYFPQAKHQRFKGARGSVVGQGELKKLARDPLFMLNHTCAMFRANINRLIRKTWCTTKKAQNLQKHINIYMCFHNETLIGGFL